MERERSTKIVIILILVASIIGLTIGFGAFSSTLTISSSAKVTPSSSGFNVSFSRASTSVTTGSVTPTKSPTSLTASSATLSGTTISGLNATFTEPGQSVTYSFYAYNAGQYVAYLKNITYGNASGGTSNRVCTANTGTTASLVTAACDDITLSVKVGSMAATTTSKTGITSHSLAKGSAEAVVVTLTYAAGGDRADGDFTVNFGNVTLEYRTAD